MKKFEIKIAEKDKCLVSHNEFPKLTCQFEDKRFNYERIITGLTNPTGDVNEIKLLQKMEKWLKGYPKEKING